MKKPLQMATWLWKVRPQGSKEKIYVSTLWVFQEYEHDYHSPITSTIP
jgi:hypothetical protein